MSHAPALDPVGYPAPERVVAVDALAAAGLLPVGTEAAIPLAGPGPRQRRYVGPWMEGDR